MIKISNRLMMAASLITDGTILADVGTDHGYVPIYLMEQNKIKRAIAMDINRGPLERAQEHIARFGMKDYIETRLSDGVAALKEGEAESILIAGMGGGLVMHILSEGRPVCQKARELVLQPQSELKEVRSFLRKEGYVTDAEEMVCEDGKYYPMMRVHYEVGAKGREAKRRIDDIYGVLLLRKKHPVLLEFLKREQKILTEIWNNLNTQPKTDAITQRLQELQEAVRQNAEALDCYNEN